MGLILVCRLGDCPAYPQILIFPYPTVGTEPTFTAQTMRTNQRKDFMMRIHVRPKDIVAKFRLAASVVASTDIAPILQFVKMTAEKEHGVTLQATDGEVAIRLGVDYNELSQDGEALLPSKRLLQILDATDEEELTINRTESELKIVGAKEKYTCNVSLPGNFPDIEEFEETAYHVIPANVLRETIRRTIFAVDPVSLKYALGGVCFEMNDRTISVVATDGRRLAWQEGYGKCAGDHKVEKAIVPAKTLQVLDRILSDKCLGENEDVKMALHVSVDARDMVSGTVSFQYQGISLYSRLLQGRFPKWREIIPATDGKVPSVISCGELLSAALKAQLATDSDHPGIQFTFNDQKLTLQGEGRKTGVAEIELDNVHCEQPKTLMLDAKFMTSFLRGLSPDTVLSIYLPPENEPVTIAADGDGYTYIVMPMSDK